MADSAIPAWKRAGLQQVKRTLKQSETAYDPLKEGLKRANDAGDNKKEAKPAKRVKVPKAERPSPVHEADQLAYLRQFSEDRENWKFSKQKQNWILKHMYTDAVGDQYQDHLFAYIKGLMGSARGWAVDDARGIIKAWNEFMQEDLEKTNENGAEKEPRVEATEVSGNGDGKSEAGSSEDEPKTPGQTKKQPKKNKVQEPAKKPISEKAARRAQEIVRIFTDEKPVLEFLDDGS